MKIFHLLIIGISLLASQLLFALGAGQATLHSALGESLMIELPISGANEYTDEELSISVASPKQHQSAGIEYAASHTHLKFETVRDNAGNPIVIITTHNPYNEPFFEALIEIQTPNEKLLKKISVLLDAPQP